MNMIYKDNKQYLAANRADNKNLQPRKLELERAVGLTGHKISLYSHRQLPAHVGS